MYAWFSCNSAQLCWQSMVLPLGWQYDMVLLYYVVQHDMVLLYYVVQHDMVNVVSHGFAIQP